MIGGNFEILDKVYVIIILNMNKGKKHADRAFGDG